MNWRHPEALLLLWFLPLAAACFHFAWQRRRRHRLLLFGEALAERLTPPDRRGRAVLQMLFWCAGWAALVLALARPRFGVEWEPVRERGADLVVCLDVSRSMLCGDVPPSRLERARSDLLDLLAVLEGDRVGLILFAGRPVLACPLTTDRDFLRAALLEAGPGLAPRGGSMLGDAVRAALQALEPRPDRDQAILLLSDGEDQDSLPGEAAREARERGVRIFTIGLGDAEEGARVPAPGGGWMLDEGQVVWSRMQPEVLRELALRTGGAFVEAGTRDYDLARIYRETLAGLRRARDEGEERRRLRERFQLFLAAGLLLLAAARLLDRPRALPDPAP